MVCSALRAVAVLAIEGARRAIAHRSAPRPSGPRWARRRARGVMCGTADPLVMYGLPRIPHGTVPERLGPVPGACMRS